MINSRVVLDEDQSRAANHRDGNLLIVAGAGSGKTATIVERVARLIEAGEDPLRILMLTFSRKACREMYSRLYERLKAHPTDIPEMPIIETYHSFGFKLIKQNPTASSREGTPSLIDESDSKKLFREAVKKVELSIAIEHIKEPLWRSIYEHTRNDGLSIQNPHHLGMIRELLEKHGIRSPTIANGVMQVFNEYETLKQQGNLVDYSDLQVLSLDGFKRDPSWLNQVRYFYNHVLVDESQDTNAVQYQLINKMAAGNNQVSVTMVGDDDQTIYTWRGARAENIRRFIDEFQPEVVKLERNYRSTSSIVEPSVQLIRHNQQRVDKKPYSALNVQAPPVAFYGHPTGDLMADRIANWLKLSIDQGMEPRQLAVLYRTNRMAKVLESALIGRQVPYKIQQGFDLFSRMEVQMLMSCIRIVTNPKDFMAFKKLSGLVKGFGDKRVSTLCTAYQSSDRSQSIFDFAIGRLGKSAVTASIQELSTRLMILSQIDPFKEGVGQWALSKDGGNFGPWLKSLALQSNAPKANFESRIQSLVQIDSAVKSRAYSYNVDEMTLPEKWSLVMEIGLSTPDEDNDDNVVTLSTVHKMKGLEFDFVHIAGFSEGLMPKLGADDSIEEGGDDLEEERRLAYVAMTRAAKKLVLHHADRVFFGYETAQMDPSRFAHEAGIEIVKHSKITSMDRDISLQEDAIDGMLTRIGWSGEDFNVHIKSDCLADPSSSNQTTLSLR